MGAVSARARGLLRYNVRATFALALIAGLAGGVVLSAWSSARRGASSFDRYVRSAGPADYTIAFCAPDASAEELAREEGCPIYDPAAEAAAIRKLSGVEATARGTQVFGQYEVRGMKGVAPLAAVLNEKGFLTYEGRPIVVAGRFLDPSAADEIVVPEEVARLYRVQVGDRIRFTPFARTTVSFASEPTGETARLRVVGVVRTPRDLAAGIDASAADFGESVPYAGAGWWRRYGRDGASFGISVLVRARRRRGVAGVRRPGIVAPVEQRGW